MLDFKQNLNTSGKGLYYALAAGFVTRGLNELWKHFLQGQNQKRIQRNWIERKDYSEAVKLDSLQEELKIKSRYNDASPDSFESTTSPKADGSINDAVKRGIEVGTKSFGCDLVSPGETVVIASKPKVGKSILAWQIALNTTNCTEYRIFPDDTVNKPPRDAVLFDAELEDYDIAERIQNVDIDSLLPCFSRISKPECVFGSLKEMKNKLMAHAMKIQRDTLYVIDNMSKVCPTLSGDQVRQLFIAIDNIKAKAKERGFMVSFLLIFHLSKESKDKPLIEMNDVYGSAFINAFASSAYGLNKTRYGKDTIALNCLFSRKRNKRDGKVYILKRVQNPLVHFEFAQEMSEETYLGSYKDSGESYEEQPSKSDKMLAEYRIVEGLLDKGYSWEDIERKTGISKQTHQYRKGIFKDSKEADDE